MRDELIDSILHKDVQHFILNSEQVNVEQLVLNPPSKFGDLSREIADQIISRRKAVKKLPTWVSVQSVVWPPHLSLEQCSSEISAAYKASILSGDVLVDLTGGMGVDTIQMSQNFKTTHYVERQERLVKVFDHNKNILAKNPGSISVHISSAENFMPQVPPGSTIYLDPARRDTANKKIFKIEDCSPNLHQLLPMLKECTQILIKLSPMLDINSAIQELRPTMIHVVSIQNECKELLFDIKPKNTSPNPRIHCVNYQSGEWQAFLFDFQEEKLAVSTTVPLEKYVYEPNASILKAGAFKSIAAHYPISKLHQHTHLYTSDHLCPDFPGRAFEVINRRISGSEVKSNFGKKNLHVLTRNYPTKSEDLVKKYKLTQAGERYLIAYTDYQAAKQMALVRLIKSDQTSN
ncbi:MAG: hypothetical protein ACI8QD_001680 [Cyclobacteriaceae bacterium]